MADFIVFSTIFGTSYDTINCEMADVSPPSLQTIQEVDYDSSSEYESIQPDTASDSGDSSGESEHPVIEQPSIKQPRFRVTIL
jgi:hypothetical protein